MFNSQLPRVCSYQSTNYTVTIEGSEPKLAVTRGLFNGSVLSDTVVISEGLESGKDYLVQVEFSSDTGALSASKDITFCKYYYNNNQWGIVGKPEYVKLMISIFPKVNSVGAVFMRIL